MRILSDLLPSGDMIWPNEERRLGVVERDLLAAGEVERDLAAGVVERALVAGVVERDLAAGVVA